VMGSWLLRALPCRIDPAPETAARQARLGNGATEGEG
jgi:hypothetical protein